MRQVLLIALVSGLALFVGGCPNNEEAGDGSTPSPSPVAVRRPPSPSPSPAATPPFANPTAPTRPGNPTAVTGLLQTLPPEARINQVPKGRTDPFAAIPVQPQVVVSPNQAGGGGGGGTATAAARPVPALPQLPPLRVNTGPGGNRLGRPGGNGTSPQRRTTRPNAARSARPARPGAARTGARPTPRVTVRPSPRPTITRPNIAPPPPPPFVPQLPPPPEPTLARGIEVTGVVDVGGVPRAIVRVPNEPSRYVQAGQRLLNGQVLVKRIEMNRGPEPVVVLEQLGVEVAKRVGERPAEQQPGSPTAFAPPPPPPMNSAPSPL